MKKISLAELKKKDRNDFSGKVLCFITDTVWGIGVVVDNNVEKGLEKIYKLKKRDRAKPLAILTSKPKNILEHIEITNNYIYDLIKLWPGALTLIFKKNDNFFDKVTSLDTIAFRVPNMEITLELLNYLGMLATTSVNISGEKEINDIVEIENNFSDYIDYLITDTDSLSKCASTIVDVTTDKVKVLRLGDIKI